ncbi:MAG: guanylate kinase [Chloroflexi bacterium]|nr:guanylate kinase [Chloroflexota bacterium]
MKKLSYNIPLVPPARPLLVILSGPSGVGKDAVLARMKEQGFSFEHVVTVTTRSRRNAERNKVDYTFVDLATFQEMLKNEALLEWANVYGNWYGVPKEPIKQALDRGRDVILRVDVQGAATIKKLVPQAVFIFLMPPSLDELATRLKQRHTESAFDLARRLQSAAAEIEQLPLFEYVVVNRNGEIDRAVADIEAIVRAEKCRVNPRQVRLDNEKQPTQTDEMH